MVVFFSSIFIVLAPSSAVASFCRLSIDYSRTVCVSTGSEELERMAHSKARVTDGKVTYPPGVKEISDKISKEEMVRRLKVSVISLFRLFIKF